MSVNQVTVYRYVSRKNIVERVNKISDIYVGSAVQQIVSKPVYGVAQSSGSSHPPNLSTLSVKFLHSVFPHN